MNKHFNGWNGCESKRLVLRPLWLTDAMVLQAITDDRQVISAISFLSAPFTLEDARKLIVGNGDNRDVFIGIWNRFGNELIGVVGTHMAGDHEIEVGYWLGTAFHGQGYATEALGAVIGELRRVYPERQIFAECNPDNKASWRVLEKVEFQESGMDGKREGRKRLELAHVS